MKNFLRFGLSALALLMIFCAFTATEAREARAQGGLNEILKRMDDHYKALKTLRTGVTMEKFNSQLGERDVTRGTAIYLPQKGRDALFRIDWTEPVQESLAVVNKEYVLCRPRLNQCITGKDDSEKTQKGTNNALAFINMSKEQLKANYNIRYLGEEKVAGSIPAWHLELTPKTAQSYKVADIWVDGNGMPIQMRVTENNNDATTVLLSNLDKNAALKGPDFKITPPKGAKIIKN
jgi:outer membrane lipoprotein-sorting protein